MAPRKSVIPLQELSCISVVVYLWNVCLDLLKSNDNPSPDQYPSISSCFKQFIDATTESRVSLLCLRTLDAFYRQSAQLSSQKHKAKEIVSWLVTMVAVEKLHRLGNDNEHVEDPALSEPIATFLLMQLPKMSAIQDLGLDYLQKALVPPNNFLEKQLLKSQFTNVTHFSASSSPSFNNAMVATICGGCPELRSLSIESNSVTDACINNIIKCQKLQFVNLTYTSVSKLGLYRLLTTTRSPLTDLNLSWKTGGVLALLNRFGCEKTFPLEKLEFEIFNENELPTVAKFFPALTSLSLEENNVVPDLSALLPLRQLKHFKLDVRQISGTYDRLSHFLTSVGGGTVSLKIRSWEDGLSPRALMGICILCPSLTELDISMTAEAENEPAPLESPGLFQNLKLFEIAGYASLSFIKAILGNAQNINRLSFFWLSNVLTDDFFNDMLSINPLSQFSHLKITSNVVNVSEDMFKQIVRQCARFKRIEVSVMGLEVFQQEVFLSIQEFIKANNYHVTFTK